MRERSLDKVKQYHNTYERVKDKVIEHLKKARSHHLGQEQVKVSTWVEGFEIGRVIGSGMIGVALAARHIDFPSLYCLKVMRKEKIAEKNLMQNIINELNFLIKLAGQPHVIQLLKVID